MAADLDVSFEMNTPTGWIELEDPVNGYELHKDAFSTRSHGHKKNEVGNDWTAGEYVSRSTQSNVLEQVDFYVGGATIYACQMRLKAVLDGMHSLSYQSRFRMGDYRETWTCTVADYTLESEQALWVSKLVLVRAKIPRHPVVVAEQVVVP